MRSKDLFPGWVGGSARAVATGDVEQAASHGGLDGSAAPSHPPCPAQELKEAPAETRQMVQSTRVLDSPAHDVPAPGVPSCISPSFINSAEPKKTQGRDGSSYCQPRPSDTSALAFWAERGRQWREAQSLGPGARLGFKRHMQVFCACKTSPSLCLRKILSLQNSGGLEYAKKNSL